MNFPGLSRGLVRYYRWRSRTIGRILLPYDKADAGKDPQLDTGPLKSTTDSPAPNVTSDENNVIDLTDKKLKRLAVKTESAETPRKAPPKERKPTINTNYFLKTVNKKSDKETPEDAKKDETPKPKKTKEVFSPDGELIYEKLPFKSPRISNLILQTKSKRYRNESGIVSVEGWRLIVDGLKAKCKLKNVLFSDVDDLERIKPFMPQEGPAIFKMPYREMKALSDLETSPGIIGIFEMPKPLEKNISNDVLPVNIICDNIREPGNLGSVLRISSGLGCEKVILTKGCVDLWNSKVVRSAAGAHFRLPIRANLEWSEIDYLLQDTSVFIADNNTDEDHVNKMKIISSNTKLDEKNLISDFKGRRYQLAHALKENGNENVVASPTMFPLIPYYGLDYTNYRSITIIIGGETEGISEECYRFAHNRRTMRLRVPLTPGVDSLNTGTAFAVIVFEIKRQFLCAEPRILKLKDSAS